MKSRFLIGTLLFMTLIFNSCQDFLTPWEYGLIDENKAFNLTSTLDGMANAAFSNVPAPFTRGFGTGYWSGITDDAEEVDDMQSIQLFNTGSWTKYSNPDDVWTNSYKGIRIASDYLNGTDTLVWKDIRYSNPSQYNLWMDNLCRNRGNMRFLRAFFYFELIKRYGEVPLITEKLDLASVDKTKYPRAPIDSIMKFIIKECDICTSSGAYALTTAQKDTLKKYNNGLLPSPYRDTVAVYYSNTGTYASQQTKPILGSALALKAKALIYAASPQFNPSGDVEKWKAAAVACKAVLDLTTRYPKFYSLAPIYQDLSKTTVWSNEFLYARATTSNSFEAANFPISVSKGNTGTCPSANLIDDFENKDGTPFSWAAFQTAFDNAKANGTTLPSPYDNRDYRLKMSVLTNMDKFNGVAPIQCYVGGTAGPDIYHGSKTGYYIKKFTNQVLDLTQNQTSPHYWAYMRLGEFYLFYAEAMNEAFGPDVDPMGLGMTAVAAINVVRRGRQDVKMPAITAGKTKDQFRTIVRHERRIELAFEDVRFWDLRRWKVADSNLNEDIRGVRITKLSSTSNDFKYEPFVVEKRKFLPHMYLYPINQTEIDKSAGVLTQNSNW